MRVLFISYLLLIYIFSVNAQVQDTTDKEFAVKKYIIPSVLLVSGALISNSELEQNLKESIVSKVGENFEFKIDDYFQYVPVAELYIADIFKVKAKNHWFDQTKYLLISNLITTGIAKVLKFSINKTRPNGLQYSFPSGHTTVAFTNATVLYNEFYQTSSLLAYSGYLFSTTTGIFRLINNKHWLSDVLFGAGLGMVVTNLVYYFEPLKRFNPFKKSSNISLLPQISGDKYGLYFAYNF